MDSLSHKIILTLAKGEQRVPLMKLQQQYPPQEYKEQCEPLIYNKAVTLEKVMLYMTPRQRENARLIYNV